MQFMKNVAIPNSKLLNKVVTLYSWVYASVCIGCQWDFQSLSNTYRVQGNKPSIDSCETQAMPLKL